MISSDELNKKTRLFEELNESQIEKDQSEQGSNANNSENKNKKIIERDKTLFDLISETFNQKKYELAYELLANLEFNLDYDFPEEDQAEIFKYFNSKIKKIYDTRIDEDSISVLKSKVFGKKKSRFFLYFEL